MKLGFRIMRDMEQLRPLELLRANSVQRFSMSPMTRDQTIAAHQWDVAMIYLWLISQWTKVSDTDDYMSEDGYWIVTGLLLALTHDMGEIFTGDAPSPFKTAFNIKVNDELPEWACRLLMAWKHEQVDARDDMIRSMVKLADVISTWHWAKQFSNPGDAYTGRMVENLEKELKTRIDDVGWQCEAEGIHFTLFWSDLSERFDGNKNRNRSRIIWDLLEEDDE